LFSPCLHIASVFLAFIDFVVYRNSQLPVQMVFFITGIGQFGKNLKYKFRTIRGSASSEERRISKTAQFLRKYKLNYHSYSTRSVKGNMSIWEQA
jgi:lipopolysaccharide/colanic/teichoic acid biosynthesis glycosyltransferase